MAELEPPDPQRSRPDGPMPPPRRGGSDAEWEVIDRYIAGECSPEEAAEVERLLAQRLDLADCVAAIRAALEVQPDEAMASSWDADAASARLARTIRGDAGASHRAPPPLQVAHAGAGSRSLDVGRSLRPSVRFWFRAAAAVALLGGGALLWQRRPSVAPVAAVTVLPPSRIYATQRGQRADLRLPDGTHVMLAAESRLSVPASFDSAHREVTLQGEAYFEATHNAAKPFTVTAGHGVVRDLGTRFDIRAYPERRVVEVLVTEGRVDLRASAAQSGVESMAASVLTQGQLGRLDSAGTTTVRSGVDTARYTGWTDGRLAFDETPLREVVGQLIRWYDLDITLADSALGSRRVTLLLRNQPVPKVLEALALVTHSRYERLGRHVRFVAGATAP